MVQIAGQRRGGGTNKLSISLDQIVSFAVVLIVVIYLTVAAMCYPTLFSSAPDVVRDQANTNAAETKKEMSSTQQLKEENANSQSDSSTVTIAFAVSVTGCGSDPITEGAAVLKHSIHRASIHGKLSGNYDYQMVAIYHPEAKECTMPLKDLGYTLLERDVFVKVKDIKGEFLKKSISFNGCCGEKELIKLEAYTLTEYPIVVHLDLDVLVLKPLDEIFDWILHPAKEKPKSESIMWPELPWPSQINAFFTMDYNMASPGAKFKPVQGGFLVLRPNMTVYQEFKDIVTEGDFRERGGWGGKVGPFYGSMTFQGLIPYFYNYLHPGQSVELSRCIYNQMVDNPRTGRTVRDVVSGKCRTGTEECEDCRSRPLEDVVTTHFTLCQKPWWCINHSADMIQHRLCRKFTAEWYKVRSEMEASWGRSGKGSGTYDVEIFHGYCKKGAKGGYLPIEQPFGSVPA